MKSADFVHVFIEKGDFGLLLQHRDDKPGIYEPGMLGVFGGHVDPTDVTIEAAAHRELQEETGLKNRTLYALGMIGIEGITPQGELIYKRVHAFRTRVARNLHVPVYEGQGGIVLEFGMSITEEPPLSDIARLEIDTYYTGRFA